MPACPIKAVVLAALKLWAHAHCPLGDHCLTKSVFVCLCITNSDVGEKKKRGSLLTLPLFISGCRIQLQHAAQEHFSISFTTDPTDGEEVCGCHFEKWINSSSSSFAFPSDGLFVIPFCPRTSVSCHPGICYLLLLKGKQLLVGPLELRGQRERRDKDVSLEHAVGLRGAVFSLRCA